MTAVSSSTTAPSNARKNALFAGSDGGARAPRRHRFADRNLQAERCRSARLSCYVDGNDVELWEGTRQVALLTRSNLPFEQRRLFAAASAPPSGRLLGNDQRSGRLCPCAGSPPAPLCVNGPALKRRGLPVAAFECLGVRRTPKGSAARTLHVRAVNGFLLR